MRKQNDFYILLIATLAVAGHIHGCSLEPKNAVPIPVPLGEKLTILCPEINHCSGQYIIEHLNHNSSQYKIIQDGSHRISMTITTLSDVGYFRCSKRCIDSNQASPYCYLNVVVNPTRLEWSTPAKYAVVGKSYNISCSATGYPAPLIHAHILSHGHHHCSWTHQYVEVDNYTGKALLMISQVSMNCLSIDCLSGDIEETLTLDATRSDEVTPSPSAVPPVSTTTTTTTQTTTTNETSTERFTPVRSNGNTGGYSISNAPRSTILVLLILTVTATHIII